VPIVSIGTSIEQRLSATYSLHRLQVTAAEWDALLCPFPTATVFHGSAWLAMLHETTGGETVLLEVRDGTRAAGYFCGLVLRKGPFRLLGSPLPGWGTPAMGPVADPSSFDQRAFLQAVAAYCRRERMGLVEMSCPWLEGDILHGYGYRAVEDVTFSMRLQGAEDAWKNIQKRTQTYIRQAQKFGVTVEAAANETAVHEHYEQLLQVFAKYASRPPYGVERPLAMWRHLHPPHLALLRAMHDDRCIASYLLAFDRETMWGLASASRQDALHLRPNDLLHWKAIDLACQRGLRNYDFCGGGDYKQKYGARLVSRVRWIRAFNPAISLAYRVAEAAWQARREVVLKFAGWARK
jgi:CelD/BcsL family acetyltransferase involved in cellulose biosynthesis